MFRLLLLKQRQVQGRRSLQLSQSPISLQNFLRSIPQLPGQYFHSLGADVLSAPSILLPPGVREGPLDLAEHVDHHSAFRGQSVLSAAVHRSEQGVEDGQYPHLRRSHPPETRGAQVPLHKWLNGRAHPPQVDRR
eukprot:CAMPEP_0113530490 /NCGR_PEP_ID=MMETSP0015_2-20120614/2967_1 /TAXON_ID=2838 /ORGANISM="Odontella" /LENGTH=134 /DNA_ID=CAMNT_0000429215 /DNA_START=24 /DNA_END=424 /DNA_ORIENTATION=+ /assembly_acc=CAM_ASM_000160